MGSIFYFIFNKVFILEKKRTNVDHNLQKGSMVDSFIIYQLYFPWCLCSISWTQLNFFELHESPANCESNFILIHTKYWCLTILHTGKKSVSWRDAGKTCESETLLKWFPTKPSLRTCYSSIHQTPTMCAT